MRQLKTSSSNYKWYGLTAMLVGTFAAVLSLSFLFPATPVIMRDFGVTVELVAWLSLAYALGATVFEPLWGRIGDMYGRKRNALVGLGLFSAGALACALSPSIWVMTGARFVQGLGAAAIIPIGMAFIGENFLKEERGRALGVWGMVSGAAPAIGPTIGGYFIDWFGWRSIYWISMILGLAAIAVIVVIVRESRRASQESFDLWGSASLFLSVGSLLVVLNQGRMWGWDSPLLGLFGVSFTVFLILFLLIERHAAHPIVDLGIIRTRLFLFAGLAVLISFLAFQGAFFLLPFFLQQVQGYPASQTGQLVVPLFLGIMGASLLSGRMSDKMGAKLPALCGTLLTSLALYLLSMVRQETGYPFLLAVMAILGVGIGATLPPLSRAVTSGVPLRQIGAATGVFNMVRNLGGPIGVAVAATIFAQKASELGQAGRVEAVQTAFSEVSLVLLVVSLVAVLSVLLVRSSRPGIAWTPEALALLGRFPAEYRQRAHSGFEEAAQARRLRLVTPALVLEVGRAWKPKSEDQG